MVLFRLDFYSKVLYIKHIKKLKNDQMNKKTVKLGESGTSLAAGHHYHISFSFYIIIFILINFYFFD